MEQSARTASDELMTTLRCALHSLDAILQRGLNKETMSSDAVRRVQNRLI
jgi:hypothetical protein